MKNVVQTRDFKAEFKAQRALTKKEVYKLKPGSWLIVKWLDAPNSLHMLLAKPIPETGDVSLFVWNPSFHRGLTGRTTRRQSHMIKWSGCTA